MEIVSLLGPDFPDYDAEFRRLADSESAYEACVGRMMLELLDSLRRDAIGPRLFASTLLNRELWLQYSAPNGASAIITVAIDHPDYGRLEDGLPRFHYRLSYIRSSSDSTDRLPIEERARSVETAREFVREAIRETRLMP